MCISLLRTAMWPRVLRLACPGGGVMNRCYAFSTDSLLASRGMRSPSAAALSNPRDIAPRHPPGIYLFSSHYDKWTDLTVEDLEALINSGDIQLLDVREPKEISELGAFPNSTNIPLGQVKDALLMDDAAFAEHYGIQKPQMHDTNIVFAAYGPIKSSAALEIAHNIGYKKARHFVGGYKEWAKLKGK